MTTSAVFDRSMIEFFIAISVFPFSFEVKHCFSGFKPLTHSSSRAFRQAELDLWRAWWQKPRQQPVPLNRASDQLISSTGLTVLPRFESAMAWLILAKS